ncbi:MAG: hypothetical protein RJB66_2224 [Pseudomonadota bacterium]|jgi:hypothetical protein
MAARFGSIILLIFLQFSVSFAQANMVTPTTALAADGFLTEGSFRGGGAGVGFSLLRVKRVYSADGNSERLIFEIGDREGRAFIGQPGYFHAQLFKKPSKLSLDLSQLLKSQVTSKDLKKIFKNSKLVKNASINSDSDDHSTNVSIQFKSSVKMRVFTLSTQSTSPKLVIDFAKN